MPEGADIFALLSRQPDDLRALLQSVCEAQANARPAPGEWSIKEVIGHVCDTERVFAYRAMRIARGDATPLPGFEQDDYVRGDRLQCAPLADLIDEFECAAPRQRDVLSSRSAEAELVRRGTASNHPVSVRALLYMMAGHVMHHIESLQTIIKLSRVSQT